MNKHKNLQFRLTDPQYNKSGWFCYVTDREDHTHPISYRLVILHAIYEYIKNKYPIDEINKNQVNIREEIANFLSRIKKCLQSNNQDHFFEENFLGVYKFNANEEKGAFLIDRAKGTFPLVFFPNRYTDLETQDRFDAISSAVNDIYANFGKKKNYYQELLPSLLANKDWDENLQIALAKKFDPLQKLHQGYKP